MSFPCATIQLLSTLPHVWPAAISFATCAEVRSFTAGQYRTLSIALYRVFKFCIHKKGHGEYAAMASSSAMYIEFANAICFKLLMHCVVCALSFAFPRAGARRLARIAMIAITTSNSMSVKPRARGRGGDFIRAL